MSSKVPTVVKEANGRFSVEIAKDSFIRWHFRLGRDGMAAVVEICSPTVAKYGFVDQNDRITFPIRTLQ